MIRETFAFDDVLLEPKYSEIKSRSEIDLSTKLGEFTFSHPIIPANMLTITGRDMAMAVASGGGLAILNRFISLEEQMEIAKDMCNKYRNHFAISVGVKLEDRENIKRFFNIGVKIVCIDIAHGDSKHCVEMIKWIKKYSQNIFIIAGNVATGHGAQRLWEAGADVVKVNVGAGSLCTTRIQTGNGVAQLTALMDVRQKQQELLARDNAREAHQRRTYPFIADGGCSSSGDLVKSLCFADMVMTGNLFAGCVETSSKTLSIDDVIYKEYVGSSTHKTSHIEGVEGWVKSKGTYKDTLSKLLDGVRSGCSYQGARNLQELKENPIFVKITHAGLKESHHHDVKVIA